MAFMNGAGDTAAVYSICMNNISLFQLIKVPCKFTVESILSEYQQQRQPAKTIIVGK